ncbi:hypothetical protein [Andreprevotia lacus]|jgi:hypothetical protein|nr:hypothetical protein [Andreprevotia lacus]
MPTRTIRLSRKPNGDEDFVPTPVSQEEGEPDVDMAPAPDFEDDLHHGESDREFSRPRHGLALESLLQMRARMRERKVILSPLVVHWSPAAGDAYVRDQLLQCVARAKLHGVVMRGDGSDAAWPVEVNAGPPWVLLFTHPKREVLAQRWASVQTDDQVWIVCGDAAETAWLPDNQYISIAPVDQALTRLEAEWQALWPYKQQIRPLPQSLIKHLLAMPAPARQTALLSTFDYLQRTKRWLEHDQLWSDPVLTMVMNGQAAGRVPVMPLQGAMELFARLANSALDNEGYTARVCWAERLVRLEAIDFNLPVLHVHFRWVDREQRGEAVGDDLCDPEATLQLDVRSDACWPSEQLPEFATLMNRWHYSSSLGSHVVLRNGRELTLMSRYTLAGQHHWHYHELAQRLRAVMLHAYAHIGLTKTAGGWHGA